MAIYRFSINRALLFRQTLSALGVFLGSIIIVCSITVVFLEYGISIERSLGNAFILTFSIAGLSIKILHDAEYRLSIIPRVLPSLHSLKVTTSFATAGLILIGLVYMIPWQAVLTEPQPGVVKDNGLQLAEDSQVIRPDEPTAAYASALGFLEPVFRTTRLEKNDPVLVLSGENAYLRYEILKFTEHRITIRVNGHISGFSFSDTSMSAAIKPGEPVHLKRFISHPAIPDIYLALIFPRPGGPPLKKGDRLIFAIGHLQSKSASKPS